MKNTVSANCGKEVLEQLIKVIGDNRDYLSEIDGAIGDGDHGINMNKGFQKAKSILEGDEKISVAEAFDGLGTILFNDIGGSMGPIYGTLFMEMGEASEDAQEIDLALLLKMVKAGREGLQEIGNAQRGDKTLIDTLLAAEDSLNAGVESNKEFNDALSDMVSEAEKGMKSTKDMVAKLGRAARLGERSRGVLDAGATSCFLLLEGMASVLKTKLSE